MMQHIGIVACSAEGASLCYRTICAEAAQSMGPHTHPEITMHTFPLNRYMECIYSNNWQGVAELMLASEEKLAKAGADFVICPDNTIHQAFDMVATNTNVPWLHIAEEVAKLAANANFQRLGILGTKYLMEGPVYPRKLDAVGIEYKTPFEAERLKIDEIIFEELVYGKFTSSARQYFAQVISRLKDAGCDAVVLGCTEIPLLISAEDSVLPILDSTRTLARAALSTATQAVMTANS
jgi:aspartate racemase